MVLSDISQGLGRILDFTEFLPNQANIVNLISTPTENTQISILQQDSVEISAEARSLWAQIQDSSTGTYASISSFAAELSGSFRSQSITQVRDTAGNGGVTALSSSQFNFSLSISYTEASMGTSNGNQLNIDPKTLEDYLLLLSILLEDIGGELNEFIQDPIGWLTENGQIDLDRIEEFISDLSDSMNNFMVNSASASGAEESLAFAFQNMEISLDVSVEQMTVVSGDIPAEAEPIVLDLDGDGIELTRPEDGILFDITGDGGNRANCRTYRWRCFSCFRP